MTKNAPSLVGSPAVVHSVHRNMRKMMGDKLCHYCEITTGSGTHGVWASKEAIPKSANWC